MKNSKSRLPTFQEKKKETPHFVDRQNTIWSEEISRKCKHEWQPISFVFEVDNYRPDLNNGRVYCVCMKCCSHTYIETGYVTYYLNSPDLLEDKFLNK